MLWVLVNKDMVKNSSLVTAACCCRRLPGCLLHKLVIDRFIKDDYLQQNSFTKYDKYCPFYKSVEMMRNIATFHRWVMGH